MVPTATDTTEVFAARLGRLLHAARSERGASLRDTARATAGAATGRQLRAIEAAEADLTRFDVALIAAAYGLDLSSMLGERAPLEVDLGAGMLRTGGQTRYVGSGDVEGLLVAYLELVRDVRELPADSAVAVRRDDVEVLARHLGLDTSTVLDRLAALIGATHAQRGSLLALLTAGAAAFVLTAGALAVDTDRASSSGGGGADPAGHHPVVPAAWLTPPPPPTMPRARGFRRR